MVFHGGFLVVYGVLFFGAFFRGTVVAHKICCGLKSSCWVGFWVFLRGLERQRCAVPT